MTNPAIKGMVGYYAPGNVGKIQDWSGITGANPDITKAYQSGIQNAVYRNVNNPLSDYPTQPLSVGYSEMSGVGNPLSDPKGGGYFSPLDQFKGMGSALMGDPKSIANLSTGQFTVDWKGDITNPDEREFFLKDTYDYDNWMDKVSQLWGAGPYEINAKIPKDVIDKVFSYQDKMMKAKRKSESSARMQQRIREAEAKAAADAKAKADAAGHKKAQATGGDYHGGEKSTVDGQTTDWGPMSHMIARGGLAQRAPRYANGGLIDFFRYGGFIG